MFEMTDGTLLEDTGEGYSRKEYEAAYQQALPRINAAKRKVIQDYLIDTAKIYFLPLLALYLLGWSVGWIRRGFRKPSSGV